MKLLCTLLGVVLLVSTVQADSITAIELQNRPAEEIIPIIQPMLGSDEAISGQGFTIVLRSSPATLARVRGFIEVLDVPARILQVSVIQGSARDLGKLGISGNIQIESGDSSIEIGSATGENADAGGSITYSTENASGSVNSISTQQRLRDSPVHQVRVAEGSEAYIETGEQIPYLFGSSWVTPGRIVGGIEYRNLITGFWVLPRIHGDNVTLQVSPYSSSRSNTSGSDVEVQNANTTITGPIGDWLLVGGSTETIQTGQRETGSYTATQSRNDTSIWIKADLVQ